MSVFDMPHSLQINEARCRFLDKIIPDAVRTQEMKTALDVGCGIGTFSLYLKDKGLDVLGLDVRTGNIEEARKRHPQIPFEVRDIENPTTCELGQFDLVLCCGLLYHLENPTAAIRNLFSLTRMMLVVESMVLPGESPHAVLVDETPGIDQSVKSIALVGSESFLVKMLYRAGFSAVYRTTELPQHEDFRLTPTSHRKRTIIVASRAPISSSILIRVSVPKPPQPWARPPENILNRVLRFMRKPRVQQANSILARIKPAWNRWFPGIPLLTRTNVGWWLAVNDNCSDAIFSNGYEVPESKFMERFLKPGMTVLDIGAHHGYFTLLSARQVGSSGSVISFEPSPREFKRLLTHVRINSCGNVRAEPIALGDKQERSKLFVVQGRDTGCNSLRPPDVSEPTTPLEVSTHTLDGYMAETGTKRVDFIKMDVEGAELAVLRGAEDLLARHPRPVILCEVDDRRTRPWGYGKQAVLDLLRSLRFRWFGLDANGNLVPIEETQSYNLVAIPEEVVPSLIDLNTSQVRNQCGEREHLMNSCFRLKPTPTYSQQKC